MDVAICADRASVRIDVTFVREIIPHGVVWTASMVRLHISSVASRVTIHMLTGVYRYVPNNEEARQKYYRKSFHDLTALERAVVPDHQHPCSSRCRAASAASRIVSNGSVPYKSHG